MKRILVALLLSACGSPAPEGADAGDVPDASPPMVLSVSPEDGATDVPLDAVVSVDLDRPVDVAIELVDDRGDAIAGTLDGATFTPARLEAERRYTASASAGGEVITWSFSTRARAWSPASMVSAGGKPSIAVDAAGNAFAAWIHDDGTTERPMASRFTPADGWSEAVALDAALGQWSNGLVVAADPAGNAIAIWQQVDYDVGPEVMLWTNRFVAGQGWAGATPLEPGEMPELAFDAAGNAIAVWDSAISSSVESVRAARYVAGVGWGTPVFLHTDDTGSGVAAQIAVRADGTAIAVWSQLVDPRYSIFASRYTPGVGWSAAELVELDDDTDAESPQIALDATGHAMAAWDLNDGGVAASRFTPGAGWTATPLSATGNHARISVAPTGEAIAAWDAGTGGVWTSRFDPTGGWAVATSLSATGGGVELGMDRDGRAVATWFGAGAFVRRYVPVTGWAPPITLSNGSFSDPGFAVGSSGDSVVAWTEGGVAGAEVWSSALR